MNVYLALFNGKKELKGGGYKRVDLSKISWRLCPGFVFKNNEQIEFLEIKKYWGLITHFAIVAGFRTKISVRDLHKLDCSASGHGCDTVTFLPGHLQVTIK